MKSFLLFVFGILGISITTWATGTQSPRNWRWRNNDGNESSATWKAAVNTPVVLNISGTPEVLRLRIIVSAGCSSSNNPPGSGGGGCPSFAQVDSLQYSTTPTISSSWVNIGSNTTNKAFRMAGISSYVTQQQPTTKQIDSSSTGFTAGVLMVSDSVLKGYSLQAPTISESEWVFMPTVNISPNITYYFRQWGRTTILGYGAVTTSYIFPSLITSGSLPVKFTRFVVTAEDKKAKLEWATATEQNNDRFEVQRSPDQRNWQTVATVKGKGNSATPVSYTAYDEKSLNGTTYYRLQQFDKDGKSTFSETRTFKLTGNGVTVSVWPNPVKDIISFSLGNTDVRKLDVVLSDASGKTIYRQLFTNIASNAINKIIPPQKLAPGVYLLQLKGDGLLRSVKILVQ